MIAPVENEKEPSSYLRKEKFEADQARTKAILKSTCSEAVRSKIRDFEGPGDRSAFAVYEYLKNEYSKQNAHSLGTLFKKIAKAKLTDYPSIRDYGNAIIDAGKRLNQLGHPIESWILTFFFLDGLGNDHEAFRQSQNIKHAESSIKPPMFKENGGKWEAVEDTSGYTKIENLLQTLLEDQANKDGTNTAMYAGFSRGQRGGQRRSRGNNRGRGFGERGRNSSFQGARGGGSNAGSSLGCRTYLSGGHVDETCFYTHPELAPETFTDQFPDDKSRRAALLPRKTENIARKNNENQKKQGNNGGRQGRGGGFAANACLPVNSVRPTMPGICLPSDSSMANTTLSAA